MVTDKQSLDPHYLELYKIFDASEQKYTYYLLAIAASAIAFALYRTQDRGVQSGMIWLLIAVLLWGISFVCGCCRFHCQHYSMTLNLRYFLKSAGRINETPFDDSDQLSIPIILERVKKLHKTESLLFRFQFYLLVTGSLSFIVWHVVEMVYRTHR